MSLFQTLLLCAFSLCCNLLLQFPPTPPRPPHTSLGNLLASPALPSQLCLSPTVPTAPALPPRFSPAFQSVTKSYLCISWQASCFWQRWTRLSFLWQDGTRSLSSTRMSSLVKTDQGGAKNIVSIWERTICREHMVSLDQILASTFR